jgi:hypothetical protein
MMNPSPPELFAERPVRSDFTRGVSYRTRRVITVSVVAAIAVFGIYFAFGHKHAPAEIPTIMAEGSYKQKPDQPGGMDIPHQDVQVYQELGNNGAPAASVEHLLPQPETPKAAAALRPAAVPMDAAPPATVNSGMEATGAPEALTPTAAPVPAVLTTVTPQMEAPKPVQTAAIAAPAKVKPVAKVVAKPKAVKAALTSITQILESNTGTKSSPVVQLASVSDPTAAKSMAEKLQSQYSAFLGGASLRVVRADLGSKGTFYRIQSQPVSTDMASQICAALKNHNAGCLIVR